MFKLPKSLHEVDNSTSKNLYKISSKETIGDPIYEAYGFLSELESQSIEIVYEHVYATYTGIKENSPDIIREGLGDFLAGAVRFFKELIKKLTEFMKSVGVYMYSMFANFDKFIAKYKDRLLEGKKDYSVMGYEYDFSVKVPKTEVMNSIVSEFNSEISDVTKLKKSDIIQRRDNYLEETNMDKVRGSILGVSRNIESTNFRQTVFEMYRKGQDTEKELKITNAELRTYMNGYSQLRKDLEEAKKDKFKLEKVYHEIQRFFEKGSRHQYVGNTKKARVTKAELNMNDRTFSEGEKYDNDDSRENLELINTYYQFKWRQSQEIGTYSFQAYVERVNALKEATKLYEKIIRAAIFASDVKEEVN